MKKILLFIAVLIAGNLISQTATLAKQNEEIAATKSNSVVGGVAEKISVSPATSTTAYTSGDNLGGILTYSNILRTSGATAILIGFEVWDKDNQKPELTIDVWSASPGGTFTDNLAEVIAGDQANWLGTFEVESSNWVTTGSVARCSIIGINVLLKGNASRNIYFTMITNSAVTYTTTTGIICKASVLQD